LNSSTQITCLVPGSANGLIGPVNVVVTDGANSFGTLAGGFTYTTVPADTPVATVAGVEAKFYLNGRNKVPGNAPTARKTVIDANPNAAQLVTPTTGTVNLQPGKHTFTILYGQGTGNYGFSLRYSGPDNGNVLGFVPDSALFVDAGSPTIASINPTSGAIGG